MKIPLIFGAILLASCQPSRLAPKETPPSGGLTEHIAAKVTGQPDGMVVEKNVMVAMRDGVRLATDIYRPEGVGRFPIVLIRTPYGSESPELAKRGAYYVEHGYALAVQDCRGKYDSEGDWYGQRDEAKDGSDAITWLGTRPWSNGKVGMTGGSYLGMVQYWVADQENPYLKALVPIVGPVTLGRDTTDFDHLALYGGRGGAGAQLGWMLLTDGRVNQGDGQGDWFGLTFRAARLHLPLADYPKIFGREMKWWPAFLTRRSGLWEDYYLRAAQGEWVKPLDDAAWWGGYEARYRKVKVPMLHISGWFDCCGEPPIKNFQLIRKLATEPLAKDHQSLMMGPWTHGVGATKNGDVDFGPSAKMDPDSVTVRWFDHWLKGEDNGVEKDSAVNVFVMGENRWRAASDWPIPGTKFTKYYFHSKGNAHLSAGGGTLATEAPATEPVDHYTYDPSNPTPEARTVDSLIGGSAERLLVEKRADVLVYTSGVVKDPVEVTGPLSAVVYLATSAPSTELWVRLIDVYPDGTAYNVFLTYANPYRTEWSKEVEQGADGARIVTADIMLPPTGILFRPGHRIRVELSSGSFPMQRSLNLTAATELTATQANVASQTIYHDAKHPSHIVLPVIPR